MQIDLRQGDCLELMKDIPDKSVDMILCDLPYGTTACKWDSVIPFEPLWEQYNRIIKDDSAVVLFGNEPFSSRLRLSNLKQYRYDWVWDKKHGANFQLANFQPMRTHENILIFSKAPAVFNTKISMRYNPIKRNENIKHFSSTPKKIPLLNNWNFKKLPKKEKFGFLPISILEFSNADRRNKFHPTQKPVALLEYLIKTYTNENELVLDNCMGSGSTGVACVNTGRNFIGIELDENYFNIAKGRIEEAKQKRKQDTFFD